MDVHDHVKAAWLSSEDATGNLKEAEFIASTRGDKDGVKERLTFAIENTNIAFRQMKSALSMLLE